MRKLKAIISFEAEFEWNDPHLTEQEVKESINEMQFRLETPSAINWKFYQLIHDVLPSIKFYET